MAAQTALLGAQRLVASTEKPLVGVIRIGSKALPVLNALRHQRKNHQGCTCRIDRHSTRVLNALRHQRKNHQVNHGKPLASLRAQRLAASTEKPLDRTRNVGYGRLVLNALRHQRKNHQVRLVASRRWFRAQRLAASTEKPPEQQRMLAGVAWVLNALRHQRKNHIDNANQLGFVDVDVLNALRHQRKNHRG